LSFPLTPGQSKAIAEDLKEEVKKRKVCPLWRGGTIPSNFKSFFAVESSSSFNKFLISEYLGRACKGKIFTVGLHVFLPETFTFPGTSLHVILRLAIVEGAG
jgi:hypothetical protein